MSVGRRPCARQVRGRGDQADPRAGLTVKVEERRTVGRARRHRGAPGSPAPGPVLTGSGRSESPGARLGGGAEAGPRKPGGVCWCRTSRAWTRRRRPRRSRSRASGSRCAANRPRPQGPGHRPEPRPARHGLARRRRHHHHRDGARPRSVRYSTLDGAPACGGKAAYQTEEARASSSGRGKRQRSPTTCSWRRTPRSSATWRWPRGRASGSAASSARTAHGRPRRRDGHPGQLGSG